jgi:glycosyltransferase involved in cell wall biosynthesis
VRILYFADIRFPLERANGIQTFETCHALARRGHRVRLVVRPDSATPHRDPFEFYGRPPEARLLIDPLPARGRPAVRRATWIAMALGRAVAGRSADVALTRDLGLASLILRLPGQMRPRLVYESHGFAPAVGASLDELLTDVAAASSGKQRRLARREARVWQRADAYVTITRGLAGEMRSRYGDRTRLAVVPDGVSLREGTVAPPLVRHRPPVVGYAGHLYPWKGVDVLLHAIARLPGVQGVIVGGLAGEPDLERTRRHAHELGIGGRVRLVGAVPPAQVAPLLAEMDVLVLPNTATHVSANYTSPLKLFEYMAAGRPIVASALPALEEVLRHEGNALLVPPGDAVRMAEAIIRLLGDASLAARLAGAAWCDVHDYRWERRAERLEELFGSMAATKTRGATS